MNLSDSFTDQNPHYVSQLYHNCVVKYDNFQDKFESYRRVAISEECGIEEEDFVYPVYKKTEQERKELEKLILNTFPCNTVTADKRDILIDAFESISFKVGDVLMKEGDYGDALFIIAEGEVNVFQNVNGENKLINKMYKNTVVGELALLYSAPRLATVIARQDVRCWKSDVRCRKSDVKVGILHQIIRFFSYHFRPK